MDILKLYRKANSAFNKLGNWDKVAHFTIGLMITFCLVKFTPMPPVLVMCVPGVIGFVKEITDINFNKSDLISWVVAGPVGALLIYLMQR